MEERWVPIPDYESRYEVSDQGRVRSLDRVVDREGQGSYLLKGRVLKQTKSGPAGKQYLHVSLGSANSRKVHRLVLLAFVGPCPPGMEACHNNGDRFDNRLSNLRWDTRSANNLDKNAHGTNHQANKTHCVRGHEFSVENTIYTTAGNRQCRICQRSSSRKSAQRKSATPEGRAAAAAYQQEWRRRTGRITGLHNYGSRTHCGQGHEFTPDNTLTRSDGGRRCKTCDAARTREKNRRTLEKRKSDPAKRAAWNAYMREYKARKRAE